MASDTLFDEEAIPMIEWRSICGYEGLYVISDEAAVIRIQDRYGNQIWRPLRPQRRRGYASFRLGDGEKQTYHAAHRLVWEAFFGPIPAGLQINHINGIRHQSGLGNIELVTCSENHLHAFRSIGREPIRGSRHGMAKLTEQDITKIFALRSAGLIQQKIADKIGVSLTAVNQVLKGRRWKHLHQI